MKPFAEKVRQSVENYLNQSLVIGNFLENCYEATFSSKANVLDLWKKHFSGFCKFLNDAIETIFWKSEAKHSKLFKSQFGYKKLPTKSFWSYLQLKSECSECLKRAFKVFCKFLRDQDETTFSESQAMPSKLFKWKFCHTKALRKMLWSYLEL